ncbi:MAG: hypothetical protein V1766_03720 [Pseudomonadota bacterium]
MELPFNNSFMRDLKRILVIHSEGNAANNPCLKAMFDYFGKCGWHCDVVSRERDIPQPYFPNVSWRLDGHIWWRLKAIAINVLCSRIISRLMVWCRWRSRPRGRYNLIIGVDRQGLIEAYYLSRMMKIPYFLISFEIMFEKETFLRFKRLEREASKHVETWIVQDELRAEKLAQENHLDRSKAFYLPVASRGLGTFDNDRLRDRLGIPKEKHVIIAMGSIGIWTMIDEVLTSLPSWPEDWVLIIHDRYGFKKRQIADLFKKKPDIGTRLFLSDRAAEYVDDLGDILNGVSYGLAFYRSVAGHRYWGDNLKFLGRSSGKIATYFRYGIPVITNEIGIMADDIKTYGLGHVVDSPMAIPALLQNSGLMDQTKNYNRCRQYFSEKLDFDLYAEHLAARLNNKTSTLFSSGN